MELFHSVECLGYLRAFSSMSIFESRYLNFKEC